MLVASNYARVHLYEVHILFVHTLVRGLFIKIFSQESIGHLSLLFTFIVKIFLVALLGEETLSHLLQFME